jgi:hypothetical protein
MHDDSMVPNIYRWPDLPLTILGAQNSNSLDKGKEKRKRAAEMRLQRSAIGKN